MVLLTPIVSSALETRTWQNLKGQTFEAELVRVDGDKVVLRGKDGREVAVKKSELSKGDLDYIAEVAPKTGGLPFGDSGPKKPGEVPNPAKVAKIDTKAFVKKQEVFELDQPSHQFMILETPHFWVLHAEKTDAKDVAETAERVWLDMNFFHPSFNQKFQNRRMAIFLVEDDETFNDIGTWQANMVMKSGGGDPRAKQQADRIVATWPHAASGDISLNQEIMDKYSLIQHARVFRNYEKKGKREEKVKGVWVPFRVHCLASDMVDIQSGGVTEFGKKGYYALTTGHAYFKEIQLTGRSETVKLRADGSDNQVSNTGGFQNSRDWPDELKKLIRKKDLVPTIDALYELDLFSAKAETNALAFAFARFLQSNVDRIAAWAKLIEQIEISHQVPEKEDLAKIMGFADAKAMETAWVDWMKSSDFK